jgi:hypothetical protein
MVGRKTAVPSKIIIRRDTLSMRQTATVYSINERGKAQPLVFRMIHDCNMVDVHDVSYNPTAHLSHL